MWYDHPLSQRNKVTKGAGEGNWTNFEKGDIRQYRQGRH